MIILIAAFALPIDEIPLFAVFLAALHPVPSAKGMDQVGWWPAANAKANILIGFSDVHSAANWALSTSGGIW